MPTILGLWDAERQDELIYHYTAAPGLAAILDSGTFNFSSLDRLNDPRENKEFMFGVEGIVTTVQGWAEQQHEQTRKIDRLVRNSVYVACFTKDDPRTEPRWAYAQRGFGRARNWDQYADRHRGCVLVLDREEFLAEVRRSVPDYWAQDIEYSDRQRDILPDGVQFRYTAKQIEEDQLQATAAFITQPPYREQFFFTKYQDWSSEREFRVAVFGHVQPKIAIARSLAGIVLGDAFPEAEANVLAERLRRLGVTRTLIAKMDWRGGAIGAYAVGASLPGFEWVGDVDDEVRPKK